jgi:hypothetical protein
VQQLAVHANVVASGVGLGAESSDHLAVHLHAALGDHLLGAAAAGHTRLRKNLLQTLELCRRLRLPLARPRFVRLCGAGDARGLFGLAPGARFRGLRDCFHSRARFNCDV